MKKTQYIFKRTVGTKEPYLAFAGFKRTFIRMMQPFYSKISTLSIFTPLCHLHNFVIFVLCTGLSIFFFFSEELFAESTIPLNLSSCTSFHDLTLAFSSGLIFHKESAFVSIHENDTTGMGAKPGSWWTSRSWVVSGLAFPRSKEAWAHQQLRCPKRGIRAPQATHATHPGVWWF